MIKVLLSGADGVMGHMLQAALNNAPDFEIAAGYDHHTFDADFPVVTDLVHCEIKADVIIDFSHFSAFDDVLDYAVRTQTPLVVGTTGLSEEQIEKMTAAAQAIPIFKTANMSLGINVLAKVLKDISGTLGGFDVEIVEKHHNRKVDAPSGTALLLADAVKEGIDEDRTYVYGRQGRNAKRQPSEIGIHALRGGSIPGEHSVFFAGEDEIIEIRHTALSRKIFANGALKAAAFLVGQSAGLYDMQDVIA